jgi:hypothetical protein
MNPFLSELYDDLQNLEVLLKSNGASLSMQSRARDARNAITWLQERLDGTESQ